MSSSKTAAEILKRKSIIELADDSGLFDINPSDLVFESSAQGCQYYDYVLSCSSAGTSMQKSDSYLYLAKFDNKVNLESFESVRVPADTFDEGLPATDLALMTLGFLTWKSQLSKSRVLCLVRNMDGDCSTALEALKRAASKFRSVHHVQATYRRHIVDITKEKLRRQAMRMRVLLCQDRSVLEGLSPQAIRETKALLNPSSNILLCLCFNFL